MTGRSQTVNIDKYRVSTGRNSRSRLSYIRPFPEGMTLQGGSSLRVWPFREGLLWESDPSGRVFPEDDPSKVSPSSKIHPEFSYNSSFFFLTRFYRRRHNTSPDFTFPSPSLPVVYSSPKPRFDWSLNPRENSLGFNWHNPLRVVTHSPLRVSGVSLYIKVCQRKSFTLS